MTAELYQVVIFNFAAVVKRVQQLADHGENVGVDNQRYFKKVERNVGQIFYQGQLVADFNRQAPLVQRKFNDVFGSVRSAKNFPIAAGSVLVAFDSQKNAHDVVGFEEFALDFVRQRKQEVVVVAHAKIFRTGSIFPSLELRRDDFFGLIVSGLEFAIQRVCAVFVDVAKNVGVKDFKQLFYRRYGGGSEKRLAVQRDFFAVKFVAGANSDVFVAVLVAQSFDDFQLEHLQNSVGQIFAAKVRAAVFVTRFDVNGVRDTAIVHLKCARRNVGCAAAAIDDQSAVLLAVADFFALD